MKLETGSDYQSSEFAKAMMVAEAKVGKTVFEIASCLGLLPWQKFGGVVDKPSNLHVVALDSGTVTGAKRFLKELCNAPKEALEFNVWNLQEDVRRTSLSDAEWDYGLYNTVKTVARKIEEKVKGGSPVVIISSLTTLALALERALAGPPSDKKGGGMDQSKWGDFARQINELRNTFQQDRWHCIWEGHIYKPPATGQNKGEDDRKETLQVSGKAGHNFPNNAEQVFRIRRLFGESYEGSKVEKTYLDTRPAMDFIAGGRGFTESLDAKEFDMTKAFYKLGLKVGRWGDKGSKSKKEV